VSETKFSKGYNNFFVTKALAKQSLSGIIGPPFDELDINEYISRVGRGESALASSEKGNKIREQSFLGTTAMNAAFALALNPLFTRYADTHDGWGSAYRDFAFKLPFLKPLLSNDMSDSPYDGGHENSDHGKLVVFNHPSMVEPALSGIWAAKRYPDKKITLPADINIFEPLAKWHDKLEKGWINLLPVISVPMLDKLGGTSEMSILQKKMEYHYMSQAVNELSAGQSVVVSLTGPSAGHQYIFNDEAQYNGEGEKIIRPVGTLLGKLKKNGANLDNIDIIPHAYAVPPGVKNFVYNGKKYDRYIGKVETAANVVEQAGRIENVDHHLRRVMTDETGLPPEYSFPRDLT
jgi:hypothetical protein